MRSRFLHLLICVGNLELIYSNNYTREDIRKFFTHNDMAFELVPWMGVLLYKDQEGVNCMSAIILIAPYFAIGAAEYVSDISGTSLVNDTSAIFPGKPRNLVNVPWELLVKNFYIHPEYNVDTVNTIAIIQLDSDGETVPRSYWKPLVWPLESMVSNNTRLLMIGFVEGSIYLEQMSKHMALVSDDDCKDFYVSEKLDFKYLWPTNYLCLKEVRAKGSCVYRQGQVVLDYTSQNALIGLSIKGPGCNLPSRFIKFFPFIPWIEQIIYNIMPRYRSKFRRVNEKINSRMPTQHKTILRKGHYFEFLEKRDPDWDAEILAGFLPWSLNYEKQSFMLTPRGKTWVEGDCSNMTILEVVYEEKGFMHMPYTIFSTESTGMYVFSLYDNHHPNISCIKGEILTPYVGQKKIFQTDSFDQLPTLFLIKHEPKLTRRPHKNTRVKYMKEPYPYKYYREEELVTTFEIHFKYRNRAEIHIIFYCPRPIAPKTTTPAYQSTQFPGRHPHQYVHRLKIYQQYRWFRRSEKFQFVS